MKKIKYIFVFIWIFSFMLNPFYVNAAIINAEPLSAVDLQEKLDSYKGKVVILNLFSITSNASVLQFKELNKIYNKYKDRVVIMSVSVDRSPKRDVDAFIAKYDLPYDLYIGDDHISRDLYLNMYFNTYIYKQDGTKVKSSSRFLKSRYIEAQLEQLLNQ